jgi:hypothetical protein
VFKDFGDCGVNLRGALLMDGFDVDELHIKWRDGLSACPCCLKKSLGINRVNVYLPWRRSFQKGMSRWPLHHKR